MSSVEEPLLELQALDQQDDGLRAERLDLPERKALAEGAKEAARLEAERADAHTRREALAADETRWDAQAGEVRTRAGELETHLYSGKVTVSRELEALQEELVAVRGQLDELELQELIVMEGIEAVEGELRGLDGAEHELASRVAGLEEQLRAGEARIDAELERLAGLREGVRARVANVLLPVYDQLRGIERMRGRVVGVLEKDTCSACRTSLPVMEARRAREAPPEKRVTCPHCDRLLLRP